MIGPQDERLRTSQEAGFSDAVTFAWAQPADELYGLARVGVQAAGVSALAVLFAGGDVAAAAAEAGAEVAEPDWEALEAGPVRVTTEEPLAAWRVAFAGDDGGFDLRFAAASPPLELAAGGLEGYEQVCRVEGEATAAGRATPIECLGQRGHGWGAADWDRIELARTVCAWWDDRHALTLSAVRPAGAGAHDAEEMTAYLLDESDPVQVAEPRLSTTYDAEGRQRRAGLELWVGTEDGDEVPRRAAGTVACGTSLELGRLRLDCAFFSWRMEGREGAGRYDVLRRA
jgi:hypothetical protein